MKKYGLLVLAIVLTGFIAGCSSSPAKQATSLPDYVKTPLHNSVTQSFMLVFKQWEGAPYQFGGTSKHGVDCSAFVQLAYRDATSVQLPRTTLKQSQIGTKINYELAESGDLVFFKTNRTTRHVGVYLGNRQFMHASTSKGVIISRLDNPYWASKFWHFRRVYNPPVVTN